MKLSKIKRGEYSFTYKGDSFIVKRTSKGWKIRASEDASLVARLMSKHIKRRPTRRLAVAEIESLMNIRL